MAKTNRKNVLEQLRGEIKAFPAGPGLYLMKDASDKVLYIGKAKSLRSRAASYFQPGTNLAESRGPWIAEMTGKVRSIDFIETQSEVEAILQEARLIKDIRPPYNSDLKDAKTFPYLEITTREEFPGAYVTRKPRSSGSRLFGPFTSASDLRAVVVELQKIFKFRTCGLDIKESDPKRRFFRPCLLYSINQCVAPCAAKIEKADYKQIIRDLIKFMQSKRSVVLRRLNKQMEQASAAMDYEKAAMYRDRIKLIERLDRRGSVTENVQPEVFAADPSESLEKLRDMVGTQQPIRIIEGFDIAHIAGEQTVGAMVQFIDGRPFKDGYRRFKIKTVEGIDDCACLAEIVTRRYKRAMAGEELWPDVILLDGGKGQLNAAVEALRKMKAPLPHLLSVAKKEEIVFVHGQNKPFKLPRTSSPLKLLQYIRDEAHRFAQHYFHVLRSKKLLNGKSQGKNSNDS